MRSLFKALRDLYDSALSNADTIYEHGVNDEVVGVVDRLLKNIFDEGRLDPKRYQDANIFLEGVNIRVFYGDVTLKWVINESHIIVNIDERNRTYSFDFNLNGRKGSIRLMHDDLRSARGDDRNQLLALIMQFIEGRIPQSDYFRLTS